MPTSSRCSTRRGAAAVEFAVCLPVLVLLACGMIEACTVIYLKQSLSVATFEGAHTAVQPNATEADVRLVAEAILAQRGVTSATVTVTPALASVAPGELFTVRAVIDAESSSPIRLGHYLGRTVESSATFMKEL